MWVQASPRHVDLSTPFKFSTNLTSDLDALRAKWQSERAAEQAAEGRRVAGGMRPYSIRTLMKPPLNNNTSWEACKPGSSSCRYAVLNSTRVTRQRADVRRRRLQGTTRWDDEVMRRIENKIRQETEEEDAGGLFVSSLIFPKATPRNSESGEAAVDGTELLLTGNLTDGSNRTKVWPCWCEYMTLWKTEPGCDVGDEEPDEP